MISTIKSCLRTLCSIPGGPLSELPECKCSKFSDIYQTTELANALHQIPHLNYMFQHVSSNFTYSTEYIQSVAFWAVQLDCILSLPNGTPLAILHLYVPNGTEIQKHRLAEVQCKPVFV